MLLVSHFSVLWNQGGSRKSDPVKTYITNITQLEALSEAESLAHSHWAITQQCMNTSNQFNKRFCSLESKQRRIRRSIPLQISIRMRGCSCSLFKKTEWGICCMTHLDSKVQNDQVREWYNKLAFICNPNHVNMLGTSNHRSK